MATKGRSEKWVNIPNYEGIYMASSLGRIMSLLSGKQKILKTRLKDNGYEIVNLWKDKKPKTHHVHRLVASSFFGEIKNGLTINHKDFNKTNNKIDNLEVVTMKENTVHAVKAKRRNESYKKGSNNGRSKLTEKDIERIRSLEVVGLQIAKMYNVSPTVVYSILKRKSWKHV